ncbi:uncharacterized protein LOC112560658 isoform X1 [Pomacea canaliculata]|uniref:uncharacterized protein LOC112560658 isoform X1 n=1 Tax=Pomacea canaliculata TaxID=400727 RepID=UPI000D72D0A1|nr:uncharacterized protein LOC112560658 isoform X1 [Pomacea canaliculata]XP_025088441.1 uncharacterized protein LOC112560658 isoform X1 [Pomacea canaliculata]XP_025088442.1 uncharacterized protein LOC112560658 isoform X1 [Pomacea canaliculata]XP_025088443.1 uncharacterized protein LOC112560658 isoform X1 [Pomacea canaliculata]
MEKQILIVIATCLAGILFLTSSQASPVPDAVSSRHKRQSADVKTAEYLAWIALGGRVPSQGCVDVACGVVDVYTRVRRSSSDQRIAELQALLALTGNGGRVAHGQFDPLRIGKKKRDFTDEQRYQLLRSLVERAALENAANLPN